MYELIQVTDNCYYIQSPAKIGLYRASENQAYLSTLTEVQNMEAKMFIPAHADPTEDIAPLAQLNIDKVYEIADAILDICREPKDFDSILQRLFSRYQLTMTFEQHALVGSTVRSYLSWLKEQGKMQAVIEGNRLIWQA